MTMTMWRATPMTMGRATPVAMGGSPVRDAALDTVSGFLREHEWTAVTMAEVARGAGVSRQTIYNEFGNRKGLAVAYVTRFVDGVLGLVAARVDEHPGNIDAAIETAMTEVFRLGMGDPVVLKIVGPNPHRDLMGIVTSEGTPILQQATDQLAAILCTSWAQLRREDAGPAAAVLVRLAFSHITMSLVGPEQAAREVTTVLSPYLAQVIRN
jgi:AcrR family transcriptional regulator